MYLWQDRKANRVFEGNRVPPEMPVSLVNLDRVDLWDQQVTALYLTTSKLALLTLLPRLIYRLIVLSTEQQNAKNICKNTELSLDPFSAGQWAQRLTQNNGGLWPSTITQPILGKCSTYLHLLFQLLNHGCGVWNSLPSNLRQSDLIPQQFCRALKTYLFSWLRIQHLVFLFVCSVLCKCSYVLTYLLITKCHTLLTPPPIMSNFFITTTLSPSTYLPTKANF